MTDLFSAFAISAQSHPSPVLNQFCRSSGSGRDSPRTIVAEELYNLRIDASPIQQDDGASLRLEMPSTKVRRRSLHKPMEQSSLTSLSANPTLETSTLKRRSPRRLTSTLIMPLEEMVTDDWPTKPAPSSRRSRSPPPPEPSSELNYDMDVIPRPNDEKTRYLRQKKRMEQIAAYRMRELKDDRESRLARRNSRPFSPKDAKITKPRVKKVKFAE